MTQEELKTAINNATNETNNTNTNNTFVPREKLSTIETIELKSLLKKSFEQNVNILSGSFESNGKKVQYGIINVTETIPQEYVGKKPAASLYLTQNQKVFGKITSISLDSVNFIPVSLDITENVKVDIY